MEVKKEGTCYTDTDFNFSVVAFGQTGPETMRSTLKGMSGSTSPTCGRGMQNVKCILCKNEVIEDLKREMAFAKGKWANTFVQGYSDRHLTYSANLIIGSYFKSDYGERKTR